MAEILVDALLPIVVTLLLGFFAGWHHDFTEENSAVLNRMVMLYALPMSLFSGLMGTPRTQLFSNLPMFFWLGIAMIGGYALVFAVSYRLFRRPLASAALQAFTIAGPAVPFIGTSVLESLFGGDSTLAVAICGLLINLFQLPLSLILLTIATEKDDSSKGVFTQIAEKIVDALKEPVVWSVLAGFLLVLMDIHASPAIKNSFLLLGKATGGVALFASGVVLFSKKVTLDAAVAVNVLAKNLAMPALIWLGILATGIAVPMTGIIVVTTAIPTASISVILSVQFNTAEKEMASTLFFSTLGSIITMGFFIWLTAPGGAV